jgi:hypothetical protein
VTVQTLRGAERQASGLSRTPQDGHVVDQAGADVSDEQIRALVDAADRLGRRRRERAADAAAATTDDRLLRLDWAVRAGRLVLDARHALSSPAEIVQQSR